MSLTLLCQVQNMVGKRYKVELCQLLIALLMKNNARLGLTLLFNIAKTGVKKNLQ